MPDIVLGFAAAKDGNMKRYNHPCTVEPAVIFVSPDGSPPSNRDIAVWPHGYPTHRVSELNEHVDPLSYPLLFPNGDLGWHARLEHKTEHQSATYAQFIHPCAVLWPSSHDPRPG